MKVRMREDGPIPTMVRILTNGVPLGEELAARKKWGFHPILDGTFQPLGFYFNFLGAKYRYHLNREVGERLEYLGRTM